MNNDKADVNQINETILNNLEKDKKKVSRKLTKMGFVNVDGNINRYSPLQSGFIPVSNEDIMKEFTMLLDNTWAVVNGAVIKDSLTDMLPRLTAKDVQDFKMYNQWVNVHIDTELIKELMDNAMKDNASFKGGNDFKGKYNLVSQILILRKNNIFSNGKVLFKLEDGKFIVIKANGVRELLNSEIVVTGDNIPLQLVKNNFRSYLDNLTDVKELVELMAKRDKKTSILSKTKPGYEKVLKIISKYS